VTTEAGATWPRRSLVVVATTSCRDHKVQMIRPRVVGVTPHVVHLDKTKVVGISTLVPCFGVSPHGVVGVKGECVFFLGGKKCANS
jgi:hypothetical protein